MSDPDEHPQARDQEAQPADERDPLAVELGRRGGRKGGVARARSMSPEQRSAAARKAAVARWEKRASDAVEGEATRKGRRSRMSERLRQAFLSGAEEHSHQSQGRALSDDELQEMVDRYPGD